MDLVAPLAKKLQPEDSSLVAPAAKKIGKGISLVAPMAMGIEGPSVLPKSQQSRPYLGGTFAKGVRRGIKQSKGLSGQLINLIGDKTGFASLVEVGDDLVREALVEAVSNPARIGGFEDIESVGDAYEFVVQTLGEQIPNLALAGTGGGMGALLAKRAVGRAFLNNVAAKAATNPLVTGKATRALRIKSRQEIVKRFFNSKGGQAALAGSQRNAAIKGAAAGTFGAFLPINTGEIIQEQEDAFEAGEAESGAELGSSLALGAVSSGLEVLGFGIVGKALFGQAKKEVIDLTLRTVLARVGHTSLAGLAGEGGTEAVQEAMVIASRKLNDPTFSISDAIASSEGLSRIAFAGVSGAVVGGVLAGGGGAAVSTAQVAQLGMQKARVRADVRPGIDALQELSKKDEGEEANSLFGGLDLARRNTYKATVGKVRAAVKEWRRAKKNDGDVATAAANVEETVNKAYDDMSTEVDALNKVKDILTEVESATLRGINTLRNVLGNMPKATAEQRPSPRQAKKVAQAVAEAKQIRDSLPKNADTTMKAENARRTLELVSKIALNSLQDPLGVPVARLEKMLNQAEKFTVEAIEERKAELDKSQRTLKVSARVIGREAGSKKKLPADPSTIEMATPPDETLASLKEVGAERKRATFIRGYGTDFSALPQAVTTQMGRLGLTPRRDVDGNRIVVVRKEDLDTPFEELEREEFPTPLAEVGEDAVVVTTRNKDGVPTKNELVPNDPAAIEEALARGTTSGTTTEARSPSAAITESVRMSNDAAEALALGLTIGQVNELVDEQSVIYVRMPKSNRLMPAVVGIDETLQREDGKAFRLFDTKAEAEKAKELKTSKQRFEDVAVENIEIVKIGDGFVIRVTLPGNRTAHKDRQVRKILRRGDGAPNKASHTILGSKDGKEVRLHLGEITKLGLMDAVGETIKNRPQPNAQTAFLNGLYTLVNDYGYSVLFNPKTQSNKVIYGRTTYENAGYYQEEIVPGFSETDFADWVMDELTEGNLNAEEISSYLWDAGNLLSEGELTALLEETKSADSVRTTSEEVATVLRNNFEKLSEEAIAASAKVIAERMNEAAFPTGREGELARQADTNKDGQELPNVNNEPVAPFYQRLYGESKTYNAVPGRQVRDLLSWPAARESVDFVLKLLHIKERVIMFDEETAPSLIAAYRVQGTKAAEYYGTQIQDAIETDTSGRIIPLPNGVNNAERVVHIYVSANRPTPQGVGRGLILMHEIGHLVQYTHLDRLSPKLRQQVLDSFGHEDTDKNREVFANWMAKVATDLNRQQRHRRPARIDSVDDFFKTVVYDLRVIFQKLRRKLKYNKDFGAFVEALNSHAAAQRGEKVDTLWMTPLGRQMFDELEAAGNSGYITTPRPGIAAAAERRVKTAPAVETMTPGERALFNKDVEAAKGSVTVGYRAGVPAVNAAERKGEGISVLRKPGEKHFGNPFSHLPTERTRDTRKTKTVQEAVDQYTAWLEGTAHQDFKQERRTWVLQQIDSGALDGKTLLYFKKTTPNHAEALKKFIDARRSGAGTAAPQTTSVERTIERPRFVSRKTVRENPDKVFVFGDNDQRKGLGGQAKAMRGEKNAVGVRTKKAPRRDRDSYYTDAELEENKKKIDADFEKLWQALADGKTIVIPAAGLGTGLARTDANKKTMEYVQQQIERLEEEAGLAEAEQRSEEGPFERAPEPGDGKTRPVFDTLPAASAEQNFTYAGIGARSTPSKVLAAMRKLAIELAKDGYTLQSGGAKGADSAFEAGAGNQKEIFYAKDATDKTRKIAHEIHPAPGAIKGYVHNLMARNTNQVFGRNLDKPVDFVLVWTPDGTETETTRKTGGTGQAIRMAVLKGIPVINMNKPGWERRLKAVLQDKQAREDEAGLAEQEARAEEVVNGIDERTPEPVDPVIAKHDALVAEYEALDKVQQQWWDSLSAEEKRIYHEYNDDLARGPATQERKLSVLAGAIQYVKGYKDVAKGESRSDSKLAQADAVKLLPKLDGEPVKRRNKLEKLGEELTTLKYDNQEALAKHPNALQHFISQFPSEKAQGKKKGRWDILSDLLVEWKANKDNPQWVSQQIARRKAYIKKQKAKFASNVPAPVQSLLTLIKEEISLLESNDLQKALVTLDKLLTKQSGVERKYDYDRYPVPDLSAQDENAEFYAETDATIAKAKKLRAEVIVIEKKMDALRKEMHDIEMSVPEIVRGDAIDTRLSKKEKQLEALGRKEDKANDIYSQFLEDNGMIKFEEEQAALDKQPKPDDFEATLDAAVEQAEDSMFQNFVDNFQNWATTLKDDPIKAGKMLVYTADAELRGMGAVGTWVARQFRALPISGEQSMTVFREIMMRAAPHFTKLNRVLNDIPGARISLWESMFNKRPSAETLALRAQRKRLNKALLLQTPLNEVDADIRGHVREIRGYLRELYTWYTGTMGMQLGRRKDYYPLMLDTLIVDKNRAKFERILRDHGFSATRAAQERTKVTRDEDGGLNNGMQDEDVGSDFLGPGFTAKNRRAKRELWTDALRAELVEEGFYQQDIATTLIAYTEMMTRRAVWERRFHDPNRDDPTFQQIREYSSRGLSINHPVATLQLKLRKALERGDLSEWQYHRISDDILPGYAGQLGLRTNSHIRKLNAGVVIYQNLRILAFAIFSQFVDVGTLVARGDFASAQAGLRQMLTKHSREDAMEMLEAIGAMRQGLTEHILNDQALNTFMTGNAKRINDLFFRYNMMEGWTNNMRALGLISGREFMQRNARKALSGDTQAQRYLDELDITAAEITAWDGHSTSDIRINAALNRYIDESMIRPDPTIRPVWMSDPGYAIFAHLKGFVYGFHETFLRRVGREVSVHQNLLPLLALGMLTLPFAAVGYELRRKVLGTSKHAPEGLDYIQELVERSGMFGAFQLVVDMEQADQYGKPFALGVGGPALEQLFDFFDRDLASWTPKAIPVVASIPAARQWVRNEMSGD